MKIRWPIEITIDDEANGATSISFYKDGSATAHNFNHGNYTWAGCKPIRPSISRAMHLAKLLATGDYGVRLW